MTIVRAPRIRRAVPDAIKDDAIDYGPLDNFIGFRLRVAQEASFRAFLRRVGDPSLKPSRFAILALLDLNPGITQTALGKACGRDKSTLTPALNELVKRGHVQRVRTAHDKRSYRLKLTASGKQALSELTARAREHDDELDRIVGKRDRDIVIRALRRIAQQLPRAPMDDDATA